MASQGEEIILTARSNKAEVVERTEAEEQTGLVNREYCQGDETLKNHTRVIQKPEDRCGNISYGCVDEHHPEEMKANPKNDEVNLLGKCWPTVGSELLDLENTCDKLEAKASGAKVTDEPEVNAFNVKINSDKIQNGAELSKHGDTTGIEPNTLVDIEGVEPNTSVEINAILLNTSDHEGIEWDMPDNGGWSNRNQAPDQQSEGDESICGSIRSENSSSSSFKETTAGEMSDNVMNEKTKIVSKGGSRFRSRAACRRMELRKRIWLEIRKEFHANRLLLNHYECVDFTVFEFGDRRKYLHFRLIFVPVVVLLTAYIFPSMLIYSDEATPYAYVAYMHVWIELMLLFVCTFEAIVLSWLYVTTPTDVLVMMHNTPWYFKMTWCCYNIIYPNMMSCYFMYLCFLNEVAIKHGYHLFCLAFLTSSVGAAACVSAMPSRIAHVTQPLAFNVFHIIFTFIYINLNGTNPDGKPYVYKAMDGEDCAWTLMIVVVWITYTAFCHFVLVVMSWCRRLLYRAWRSDTKPVYGFSPEEFRPFKEESAGVYDRSVISRAPERGKGTPNEAHIEAPIQKVKAYSPHLSYRLSERRLTNSSPPKTGRLMSNLHNMETHLRRNLNPRSAFTDIHPEQSPKVRSLALVP